MFETYPLVAAVQFEPSKLDVQKNVAVALQLSFEAAAKGASVIVLPELCMSGYSLTSPEEAASCSQDRLGYQTEAMSEISKRFGCHIIFGYVELHESRLYNSAAVVGPMGLEANVQKHNLYGADNMWAEPAESLHPVVITKAGRLGILICRDIMNNYRESYQFFSGDHRFYRQGSADTVALLTNWGSTYAYPDSSWVELGEELRSNVIVSNRVGTDGDVTFKGGSCIIDRDRRIWTNGSSFSDAAVVGGYVKL